MNGGVTIQVVAMVTNIFTFCLAVVAVGVCARIAGARWAVLKGPANRVIVLFCVFAAASFYILMKYPVDSCANASIEVWRPAKCGLPWVEPPPPREVRTIQPWIARRLSQFDL
jgi:hypothetical protein